MECKKIKQFTIRPMFHYNANLKSDVFGKNKEPLKMTVLKAPACHCTVQKFTMYVIGSLFMTNKIHVC